MKSVKIISSFLALISILSVFAACGSNDGNKISETTTSETKPENSFKQDDDLPERNLNGLTFTYLTATEITGGELTVMDTEDSDDPLLSTIYKRTAFVEDRFNVDVVDFRRPYSQTYDLLYQEAQADDGAFDAGYGFVTYMFPLALEGCLIELSNVPYVDLSREWWDQNAKEAFSVSNKLFFMAGDANMFYNDYTWVMFFNKQVLKDIKCEEPYALVESDSWTLEQMMQLGSKAIYDIDGNQKIEPANDRVGMVTHQYTANAMLYGCNELFFKKDEETDLPYIAYDTERTIDVCFAVEEFFAKEGFMLDTTNGNGNGANIEEKFTSNNALFAGEVLQCARRWRGMEADFGILPYPKYDDTQDNYVSYSLEMVYPVGFPKSLSNDELEIAGLITEAMQSASHNSLYKAYFEAALTSKRFLRDDQSEKMMSIIFETRCFPFATMMDFNGIANKLATACRINNKSFSSLISKSLDSVQTKIDDMTVKIDNLE